MRYPQKFLHRILLCARDSTELDLTATTCTKPKSHEETIPTRDDCTDRLASGM